MIELIQGIALQLVIWLILHYYDPTPMVASALARDAMVNTDYIFQITP